MTKASVPPGAEVVVHNAKVLGCKRGVEFLMVF